MKLISWNVNGLRACLTKGFLDFVKDADPDVICLNETKMKPEQADFDLPGYERYWNSADKPGYSGVAVFTKKIPEAVTYDFGDDIHRHEGRVITADYGDFFLVSCYTPNSQDGLKRLDYRMVWEDDFRGSRGNRYQKSSVQPPEFRLYRRGAQQNDRASGLGLC